MILGNCFAKFSRNLGIWDEFLFHLRKKIIYLHGKDYTIMDLS